MCIQIYIYMYVKCESLQGIVCMYSDTSVSPRINEQGGGGYSGCTECEIVSGYLVHVHVHTPFTV